MKLIIINFLVCFELFICINTYAVDGDTRESELAYANSELNAIYQKIMSKVPDDDKIKLRAAQKAWLRFRDLDCQWAFKAEPLDCLIDRTTNRTKELTDTYY